MSNDQKSADLNVLEKIKNALGTECPQCNEINPITLSHCDKCGTVLPFPGEEISTISYVDSERPTFASDDEFDFDSKTKIPIEKAKNLILLRQSLEGLENGEITLEEYRQNVNKVKVLASAGVELFSTDVIKEKVASLPDDQKELAERTRLAFNDYLAGCQRMLEYQGGEDITAAQEGYETVEQAIEIMDEIQDRAMEIIAVIEADMKAKGIPLDEDEDEEDEEAEEAGEEETLAEQGEEEEEEEE
jgi:uncharacterized protein YbcV (DUF1398 family)